MLFGVNFILTYLLSLGMPMEKKQAEIGSSQSFGGINEFHKFMSGSKKANTVEGQQQQQPPPQPQSKTLNSENNSQVDKPTTIATNTTKTCSVKLVDIGPKTTPAKSCSDNNTSSVTSDESSGDSQVETLKRDLPPHSLETSDDSDEPNPKRVRPSLPEQVATGRMLLKPKDFIDLKKRTVSSSSLSDSSRLKSNIKPPNSSSSAAAAPAGSGGGGDHKAAMSTASAFDRVEEELGHLFGASSPQKKDNINNSSSSSKVTISPVRSSSSSTTKEQTDSTTTTTNKQVLNSNSTSSSSSLMSCASSATLTTQSSICAPTTTSSSSSSTGSVTITKLSTGSSLSVESKDLKTILSSSGGNRALSNNPTAKAGSSLENGFKLKKQNVDIVSMSSTTGNSTTSITSNKSEQLSPTDSIKCNKCNEEYSTKEARRLHTCNSILDQHYLSVDNTDRSVQNPKTSSSGPTSPLSSATHNDHGQSSGGTAGGGGAHSSSSPPSSFDSASSRSSSPMMEQWNNSGNKKQPPPPPPSSSSSSGGVKLIQEHSEKLIIEGRPKLSVTKVSRLEAAGGNNLDATLLKQGKYSQSGSGGLGGGNSSSSPTVPKLKLMTHNSSNNSDSMLLSANKKGTPLDHAEKNVNNKSARWSTAIDNSYNGKLKIKLQTEKVPDKNSASSSSYGSRNTTDSAPEGGMPFAFAGKPTYSPSRIEPSNGNGTVQTKGKCPFKICKLKKLVV